MIIVLFHVLYLFGKFVYQNYRIRKEKAIDNEVTNTQKPLEISEKDYRMIDPEAAQDFKEKSLRFFPPAYVQRYVAVSEVLNSFKYQGKLRKVVDFGCAELDFLVYLKHTTGVEEILCVDIDRVLLESYKEKGAPLISEYLHRRTTPLVVEIFEGSVTHNDKKLEKTDAVICIELIEHLYPDTLMNLPYNIFGFVKPKLAVITTPNADFNVLFPNFSGFRHADHKFEWTRQQFQDWAENIILRYPDYIVTFDGICKGPEGTEHLGCCTQMAIFHRLGEKDAFNTGIEGLFITVARYEYPFRVDNRSDEQKILDEAEYYIRHLSFQDIAMEEEVPLKKLLEMLKSFHISIDILQSILEEAGWTVTNREFGPVVQVPPRSTFSDYSTVGEAFWSNDYSTDEDDWNRDPGPPINSSRFLQQNTSDAWDEENWNEEPSIIIPENNSIIEDNTYLFDEENVLSNNISEAIKDSETANSEGNLQPETTDIDHAFQYNLSLDLQQSTTLFVDSSSLNSEVKNLKDDPFLNLPPPPDVSQCTLLSDTGPKLNETLDFLPYLSVSRASTSPEPYLLQTVRIEQHFTDDSSMSNYWMLDNSLNVSGNASDIEDKKLSAQSNINDSCLRNIHVNTSCIENEHSNFELLTNSESISSNYFNLKQMQSVQQHPDDSKDNSQSHDQLHSNSSVSLTSSVLTESQPQFTSSPNVAGKINTTDKDRLTKEKSSNSSLKRVQLFCLTSHNGNNSLESNNKVSLESDSKLSCNEKESEKLCESEIEISTDGKDDTFTSSDVSTVAALTLNDVHFEQVTDDFSLTSTLRNDDNLKKHKLLLPLDHTNNFIEIEEGEQPNGYIAQATSSTIESTNCDKKVPLTDQQLIVKSGSCMDFVHVKNDEKKTERKSESRDISNLRSNTGIDTSKSSYNYYAKEISSVECVPLVSCSVYVENTQNVQSTSVLLKNDEKQAEFNESTCKALNSNALETVENNEISKISPSETVETPPNSWSPEVMDSGYPNSTSAQDMTPEYDLSSIAQDHISDSEPPSIAEAPRLELPEVIEVVNGDLVNNNRDNEGNNMIAAELNDLEDLQPLINVLENDMENENDIYVLENGFPFWLLRILNMANPIDVEIHLRDHGEVRFPNAAAVGDDARYINMEHDEGFNSSSEENSNLENNEMRNDNNSDASDNIENDNENSDSGSEEWIAASNS
uniref:MATH and LRR domain-containing protein PFE0570w isoform X1 n=2 Tax=Osmia lignaria TaxID=473952 RepID=UPI001478498B|nr:MATH and LRR domain-containing protein PFE0570w isoform X1 [Osmia lignaria]